MMYWILEGVVYLARKHIERVLVKYVSTKFIWCKLVVTEFDVKRFSRSEANKFALSMFDIARGLFGLRIGGIWFHWGCF